MTGFRFIPSDWYPSDELYTWTKNKGLTDAQIEDELESFRDHQFKTVRYRPDACWRTWIKNAIRWGRVVPCIQYAYRRPEELTDEQREADRAKAWREMNRLKAAK